jgi:hypothetical protein
MVLKGKEGVGSPPYSNGPYNWNQDLTLEGRFTRNPYRYYLEEHFSRLPQLNATIDQVYTTEAARAANQHFEILGTNASDDDVTFASTIGGIQLQTDGADNDQVIVLPHLDTNGTAWTGILWGTENQVIWEATIRTDAITAVTIWAGLKLTNTSVIATDDDQVFFRYAAATDTNWKAIYSIGDTDTNVDTGIAVAANTNYYFRIEIDSERKAHFFINDTEVVKSTALTNDVDFIPYVGVHANTNAAKTLILVSEKISRIIFE